MNTLVLNLEKDLLPTFKKELRKNILHGTTSGIQLVQVPKEQYVRECVNYRKSIGLTSAGDITVPAKFYCAKLNGKLVAGNAVYPVQNRVVEVSLWRDKTAPYWVTDWLKYHVMLKSKQEGYSFYDFAGRGATSGIRTYKNKWNAVVEQRGFDVHDVKEEVKLFINSLFLKDQSGYSE